MTTQTLTLTDFLLQRIADDEAVARKYPELAGGRDWWELSIEFDRDYSEPSVVAIDPARVLAECAAKKAIVDESWSIEVGIDDERGAHRSRHELEAAGIYPDTLRALASIYVDHESFDPRWSL